jgi:hypothetical protein
MAGANTILGEDVKSLNFIINEYKQEIKNIHSRTNEMQE